MSEQCLKEGTRKPAVHVEMYADGGAGRTTVLCLPLIAGAPVAGRYAIRGRTARNSPTGADT